MKPCIGFLEFNSIALGIQATDAMLKKATIEVLFTRPVSRGKYLTLIHGEVEEVQSALCAGREVGAGSVLDELFLANLDPRIIPAVNTVQPVSTQEAMGIIETLTCPACIQAADTALKTAQVELLTMQLARGIGGKAYFIIAGAIGAVESAVLAAVRPLKRQQLLVQHVIIAQADPALWPLLSDLPQS